MEFQRSEQTQEIVRTAVQGIFLGFLFLMLAYLTVSNYGTTWPWREGISGILLCSLSALALLSIALLTRRAYQFQIAVATMSTAWLIPLIAAGLTLASWSMIEITWVLILCVGNVLRSYQSAMKRLSAPLSESEKTGRLDTGVGVWNIGKPLFIDVRKENRANLAKLLIPLGSALGAILFMVGGNHSSLISAGLMFMLAFFMIPWPGTHLAAAVYLIKLEKKTSKKIMI